MKHLRPQDISFLNYKSSCRRRHHRYGAPQQVGGGILRQVCLTCGSVTIDLTGATDVVDEPMTAKHLEA